MGRVDDDAVGPCSRRCSTSNARSTRSARGYSEETMRRKRRTPEEWAAEKERRADLDRRIQAVIDRYRARAEAARRESS
jgi:hypothetical protein